MAKTLYTAAVADIRNKLNGSVFSKNRYGGYIRTKVTPVNPQSTAQQLQRNRLSTNSAAWRGLTEAQRQSWIDGAVNFPQTDIFGNTKILSGQALYCKFNNNLAGIGVAAIATCPSPVAIPALAITSVASDASDESVEITATTPVPTGFKLVCNATPNVTPGRSFVKNQYRFIKYFAAAAAGPFDIGTDWVAKFGAPVAGNKVFVQCFLVSSTTGQAGIPVSGMAIVTA